MDSGNSGPDVERSKTQDENFDSDVTVERWVWDPLLNHIQSLIVVLYCDGQRLPAKRTRGSPP